MISKRFTENPDEIVLEDVKLFHLEQMNSESLWIGCYTQNNKIYHLNIYVEGNKLLYFWRDETHDEVSTGHRRKDLDVL